MLKDSLTCAEHFVQRFLKVIGRAREIGADLLQGYYFGKAAPASELQLVTESNQAV